MKTILLPLSLAPNRAHVTFPASKTVGEYPIGNYVLLYGIIFISVGVIVILGSLFVDLFR